MKRLLATSFTLALLAGVAVAPAVAKDHSFAIHRDASVNGVVLEARKTYRLKLNGNNEAHIYRNRELVTTVPVEIKPLAEGQTPNSVSVAADGTVLTIRTKDQVIVLVPTSQSRPEPAASLRPILLT